jgi:hypothetical protein
MMVYTPCDVVLLAIVGSAIAFVILASLPRIFVPLGVMLALIYFAKTLSESAQ